jgi:uracil-DNA glycosylase family 4
MIIPKITSTEPKKSKENSFDALAVECPPTDNINSAIIAMVGEAPSDIELLKGEPFVGPTGSQLNRICAAVRLARYQIYLTNACKAKLPKNDTDYLWTSKGYRHPDWGTLQTRLIEELSKFPGKLIMLLGATPMKLLIDEPRFDSISKYRGSFYPAEMFPHLKEKLAGKIIGLSFHPSHTMSYNQPIHFYTMIADFNKALKVIENPDVLKDITDIKINPTLDEILRFYALIKTKEHVAFDIECTPEFITCFSLAIYYDEKIVSMSIPFLNNQGNIWSPEEEVKIWKGVAEILNDSNIKKICQNGMFDLMFILRTMNIKTDNFFFDTMLAQHRCYTELPKGLDYLTSAYTFYPYYKDEGKQSHLKVIKDWPQYWVYNAKDSAYLLPIAEALIKELEEFDSTDVMAYMMDLHKPLMEMEFNGILTNKKGIIETRKKYERWVKALQHGLNKIAGKELNPSSSKQMIAYFYGICMIKPYINRTTGNASCDTVALHRIAKKNIKGSIEARMIIKIRKYNKLISTYFDVPVDDDNRLRCSHKISGTVSGRIATERTFFGTGCLLPSAEVLTPNGWIQLQYFQEGMQAMQWDNKTDSLSWCVPKLHKEFYFSKMMQLKSTQTEGIFTADHRIPSYHPGHKTFSVNSAYETSCLSERLLPLGSSFNGTKELPPLLLRLIAMVQADCTIEESNIRVSFKKKNKINRFLKLMALGNIDYTEQKATSGYRRFCISSNWSNLIKKFLFDGKTLGSWMYDLTLEAKEAFIDEIKYWDAHRRGQSYIYYTTNEQNVEIISTLAHLVGKSCTILINYNNNNGYGQGKNKPLYSINIKPRTHARINKQHWKIIDYTGMVYCLQTPTSFFLVRNNKNIQITGNTNLQNQPYLFKQFLISDPGWILCECDLAKAEAHVVAYLTQDANMIDSFTSGIDVHSFNASKIFNVPIEEVIKESKTKKDQKSTMRYMGKKVVHASNYAMGPQTFSDNLATEEIFMSQAECKKLLQNYQDRFPGLKRWHQSIEEEVQKSRILYNLFNSPRRFLGDMGPSLFRNAYSYKPQSTVAELLNRGSIKISNDPRLGKDGFDIRLLTTVHDSILFQFHKDQIPNLLQILLIIKDHLTYTFTYKGKSFTIGLDAKIGQQWAGKTASIDSFTQENIDKAIAKLGELR